MLTSVAGAVGTAASGPSRSTDGKGPRGEQRVADDEEFDDAFRDDLEWDEELEKSCLQIEAKHQTQVLSQSQPHQPTQQYRNATTYASQRNKRHLSTDESSVEEPLTSTKHARIGVGYGYAAGAESIAAEVSADHARVEALLQQLASKEAELHDSRRKLQAKDGEVTILRSTINRTIAEYSDVVRDKEEKLMAHHAAVQQFKQANDELQAENKTLKSFRTFEAGTNAGSHPHWSSVTASVARRRATAGGGAGGGQMSVTRDYSQSHSQTMAAAVGLTTPTRRNRNVEEGSSRGALSSPVGHQNESPSSRRANATTSQAPLQSSNANLAIVSGGGSSSTTRVRKGRAAFPGFVNSFARSVLAQETQRPPEPGAIRRTETRTGPWLQPGKFGEVQMAEDEVFRDRGSSALPSSSPAPDNDVNLRSSQSESRIQRRSQSIDRAPSQDASRLQTSPPQPPLSVSRHDAEEARQLQKRSDAQLRYLWAVKTYSNQQGFLASLILSHNSEPCVPLASSSTLQRVLRPTLPVDCPDALRKEYDLAVHHFLNTLSHGTALDAEDRFMFLQELPLDDEDAASADDWQFECMQKMDAGMMDVLRGTITALRIMMAVSFEVGEFAHVYDVLTLIRSIVIHFLDAIHAVVEDVYPYLPTELTSNDCVTGGTDGEMDTSDNATGAEEAQAPQHGDIAASASMQRKPERKLELNVERILAGSVRHTRSRKGDASVKAHNDLIVNAVVGVLDVLTYHTRHNDATSLQCAYKVKVVLSEPDVLTTLLDGKLAAAHSVGYTLDILAQLCQHDSLWRVALAAARQDERAGRYSASNVPRTISTISPETALLEVLAKLLVDGRLDMDGTALHRTHCATITFLSQLAVCHPDEAGSLVAHSGPILAALIKCLQLDTDALWISGALALPDSGSIATDDATRLVGALTEAVERVCMDVRLMALLYRDTGDDPSSSSLLAQTLVSPQSQLLLNGIRHFFVVALSRIAFQLEPSWMETAAAIDGVEAARTALNECNDVAAELLELVLAPDEIEACWEALAEDDEDEGEGMEERMDEDGEQQEEKMSQDDWEGVHYVEQMQQGEGKAAFAM